MLLNFARDKFLTGSQVENLKKILQQKKGADQILGALADLRHPHNWYETARAVNASGGGRKIIFHVGPTNSAKTFEALQRIQQAKTGVYCGPLRLLAEEVYRRMNDEYSIPCNLRTGQRVLNVQNAKHVACTVEMADINKEVDCAVVDEIQMISDRYNILFLKFISVFLKLLFQSL